MKQEAVLGGRDKEFLVIRIRIRDGPIPIPFRVRQEKNLAIVLAGWKRLSHSADPAIPEFI